MPLTTPDGWKGVFALYGDPSLLLRDDGTVSPLWEARMVVVPFPAPLPLGWDLTKLARGARVHQVVSAEVDEVFDALARADLWRRLRTYDGGYAWRTQRGSTKKPSLHSFGAALDFDADTNRMGTRGDMDPRVVEVFEGHGWTWGGRFKRPDPMHVQFARGV